MASLPSSIVALERPPSTEPARTMWTYCAVLGTTHLLALLACVPWLFSWTGVALVVIGHHVFGMLGTTLGYHRLLTHRGFTCPLWFEHMLALLGTCCLQDSPARWVAMHRQHHQFSDERADPHSPLVKFFWGHMHWLMVENREHHRLVFLDRYARDLLQDPFYVWLERHRMWLWVYVAHAIPFFVVGFAVGAFSTGQWLGGLQFGLSLLVWGVFVRTVAVWHFTWSVNSLSHLFGYRNYDTGDNSRNNWFVALVADGEGWHNNHHAEPRAASHGHLRWEFDSTWCVIRLLERVGLAKDVIRPQCWKSAEDQSSVAFRRSSVSSAATHAPAGGEGVLTPERRAV